MICEGRGNHHLFGSGFQVAPDRPFGVVDLQGWIQELTGGIHYQTYVIGLPVYGLGGSCGSQQPQGDAVHDHRPSAVVDVGNHRLGLVPMEKGMQGAIRGVPFQIVGDVHQAFAGLPADVDHDFVEVPPSHMMPQGEFADAAEAVDTDFHLSLVHGISSCSGFPDLHGPLIN